MIYRIKEKLEMPLYVQPLFVIREAGKAMGVASTSIKTKEEILSDMRKIQMGMMEPLPEELREPKSPYNIDVSSILEVAPLDENGKPIMFVEKDGDYSEDPKDPGVGPIVFMDSGIDLITVEGVLEQHGNGFGFIRTNNFGNSPNDVYISKIDILRYNLRSGDKVKATALVPLTKEAPAVKEVLEVNGLQPRAFLARDDFDELVATYPNERIKLENENDGNDCAMRIIDLFSPIGKGQRGLIVAPPKAGKTTLIKNIAKAIEANNKDIRLLVLLIDERPEEVTDIMRCINAEVIHSNFDECSEHHIRAAECVFNRAKRLVEGRLDVVILMDSITKLVRAYNNVVESSGKTLSGGLDPTAMSAPKRFFGSARNIEDGGSLTVISTALIDTGSRLDDIVYEEFKGTGNMEIVLSRELSERRIFPAIDIRKSGTRREEMLLSNEELDLTYKLRKFLSKKCDDTETLIEMMKKTKNNKELEEKIDSWLQVYENN